MADQDLSDEQLQQILKAAAQRINNGKKSQATQERSLVSLQNRYENPRTVSEIFIDPISISKVTSEKPIKPYINTTKNGAHVDSSYLVKPEERKLASKIRVVQDPVALKANAAQV